MGIIAEGQGNSIVIVNRNEPAFYCVSPELSAWFMALAEDAKLNKIADERVQSLDTVRVNLDDFKLEFDKRALKEWQTSNQR